MSGSYYDLLGVPVTADQRAIRARYLLLMRRHHPDVNRSPTAHSRAAELNAAFRLLVEPDLRARYDAELAAQRVGSVTARAISLYRGGRSRGREMVVRRRTSALKRSATRLGLATVLSVTVLTGWQIQRHLLSGNGAVSPPASADDSHTEARKTVAAVNAATVEEAHAMPPVSPASVADGVEAFRRLGASGALVPAQKFSLQCHENAANLGTWGALDMCAAFDHAAFMRVARDKIASASAGYFIDRHDRAAHLYVPNVFSMDAIALRLDSIRGLVTPAPDRRLHARTAGVLHPIAKPTRALADAERPDAGPPSAMPAAYDF